MIDDRGRFLLSEVVEKLMDPRFEADVAAAIKQLNTFGEDMQGIMLAARDGEH